MKFLNHNRLYQHPFITTKTAYRTIYLNRTVIAISRFKSIANELKRYLTECDRKNEINL